MRRFILRAIWSCPLLLALLVTSIGFARSVEIRQNAEYIVPIESADLQPYATHTFQIRRRQTDQGVRTMDYDLPVELTGVAQEIDLLEVSPNRFEGAHAVADCQELPEFNCKLTYRNLSVDAPNAESTLLQRYNGAELAGRTAISRSFRGSGEPIGILKVR
jgi:hypothetical protein